MGEVVTTKPLIEGVSIRSLRTFPDERGCVMHMLRADEPGFEGFGEIYFSTVLNGAIKAWKRHRQMIQRFAVPVGEILLVVYDDRAGAPTRGAIQEIETGSGKYGLIRIPRGVWYGFQGIGTQEATSSLVVNCASIPHDPDESARLPINDPGIPYHWPDGI